MQTIKKLTSAVTIVSLLTLVVGCAAAIPFAGKTVAGESLKSDALRTASAHARAANNDCKKIDAVETQLLKIDPVGTTGGSRATQLYGSVHELWTLQLCGESARFDVKFTPDGQGGTYYAISSR